MPTGELVSALGSGGMSSELPIMIRRARIEDSRNQRFAGCAPERSHCPAGWFEPAVGTYDRVVTLRRVDLVSGGISPTKDASGDCSG